jgi:hypothetical protein
MSIIQVQDLSKVYRIVEKDPGIAGSFKALFRPRYKDILAVDHRHDRPGSSSAISVSTARRPPPSRC